MISELLTQYKKGKRNNTPAWGTLWLGSKWTVVSSIWWLTTNPRSSMFVAPIPIMLETRMSCWLRVAGVVRLVSVLPLEFPFFFNVTLFYVVTQCPFCDPNQHGNILHRIKFINQLLRIF